MQGKNGQKLKGAGGGSSKSTRILIVAGLAVGLLIGFGVLMSFLGRESAAPLDAVQALTAKQSNLIYTSSQYTLATDRETVNYAVTVYYAMQTSQQQTVIFLQQQHRKVDAKKLAVSKNIEVDQTLAEAKSNNTYDQALTKLIQQQLAAYAQAIQDAQKVTKSKQQQALLQQQLDQLKPLAGQSSATAPPSAP
jgi:hypothetical protein